MCPRRPGLGPRWLDPEATLFANRLAREIGLLEGEDLRRLAATLDEAAARRDPG